MQSDAIPSDLIQLPEAATLLGISRQSMLRWCIQGKIRAWRVGHRWRVSRADVVALCKPWSIQDANDRKIAEQAALPMNRREQKERDARIDAELKRAGIRR